MYDFLATLGGLALGIGFLVMVARALERRARTQGPLFARPPSVIGRVAAVILALVFAAAFAVEFLTQ